MTAAAVLATGFLILAVGSGARFAIGLTLQPMAQDFAMGRGMLGIIVAIYFICTAVCMFLAWVFLVNHALYRLVRFHEEARSRAEGDGERSGNNA